MTNSCFSLPTETNLTLSSGFLHKQVGHKNKRHKNKLRIVKTSSGFNPVLPQNLWLKYAPSLKLDPYSLPGAATYGTTPGRPVPGYKCTQLPVCTDRACTKLTPSCMVAVPKFYMYEEYTFNQLWPRWLNQISSKYRTRDPAEACFFVVFHDTPGRHTTTVSKKQWNGGVNHVIVDTHDMRIGQSKSALCGQNIGHAMLWKSSATFATFRPHHDVSIPLGLNRAAVLGPHGSWGRWSDSQPHDDLRDLQPEQKKYIATFMGTAYDGEVAFDRTLLLPLVGQSDDGIVLEIKCRGFVKPGCSATSTHKYADLLNSTFVLAPGGRQVASFRLMEALSVGAIPVVMEHELTPYPFEGHVPWQDCALDIGDHDVPHLASILKSFDPGQLQRRHAECKRIYEMFFQDAEKITMMAYNATIANIRGYTVQSTK